MSVVCSPDKFCQSAACIFNKMIPIRTEIKTLTPDFYHIAFSKMQSDPRKSYPDSSPTCGLSSCSCSFAVQQKWFHLILLCIRHDPLRILLPLHQFSQKHLRNTTCPLHLSLKIQTGVVRTLNQGLKYHRLEGAITLGGMIYILWSVHLVCRFCFRVRPFFSDL